MPNEAKQGMTSIKSVGTYRREGDNIEPLQVILGLRAPCIDLEFLYFER
jgi:hypothetical protein